MNTGRKFQRDRRRELRARALIEAQMTASGMKPERLPGHGYRYRVWHEEQVKTCAVKVCTRQRGWMGIAQKRHGAWGSPLNDTDFVLYGTVDDEADPSDIHVHLYETATLRRQYEDIQEAYNASGRDKTRAALWGNAYDVFPRPPAYVPCQYNLAQGRPPLWTLPYRPDAPDAAPSVSQPRVSPSPVTPVLPVASPAVDLSSVSLEQLLAEIRKRGIRGLNFD